MQRPTENIKAYATLNLYSKHKNNSYSNKHICELEQDKVSQIAYDNITALCILLIYSLQNVFYYFISSFCNQLTLDILVVIANVVDFIIKCAFILYIFGLKYTLLEIESRLKYLDSYYHILEDSYQNNFKHIDDRISCCQSSFDSQINLLDKKINKQLLQHVNNSVVNINQSEDDDEEIKHLEHIQSIITDISNNIIKLNENNETRDEMKIHLRQMYNSFEILLSSELKKFKSEISKQIEAWLFEQNTDFNELQERINNTDDNLFTFIKSNNLFIQKIDNMLDDNISLMHEINIDNIKKLKELTQNIEDKYTQIINIVDNREKSI